jgi:hypothetical protein
VTSGCWASDSEPPARGSTPVAIIDVCHRLVVQAGVALRAVPRVFGILFGVPDAATILPEATSVRWWLQRLGLFALREQLEVANDWAYLIDHSVQIGTVKVCVILGLRLRHVPFPTRALRHDDVRVLAVIPTERSTGEIVDAQLEQAAERTGPPRQIVSDHGSDVKKGSELFAQRHPNTVVTYDAAHHGAIVLQRRFQADPRWPEFIARLGEVKARIQQTSDAFLLAPSLRPKARYMNLASLLRWGRKILTLLDRGPGGGVASARAELRYGWLREFRVALEEWARWEATVRRSVEFVRTRGLSHGCELELSTHLLALPADERDEALAGELSEFTRTQSEAARPGERLVASTEVLESLFGKWKALEHQESRSGITSLILSLGSLVGQWPLSRIKAALEETLVKHVVDWCHAHLPATVQSQRRLAFATPVNESRPITPARQA